MSTKSFLNTFKTGGKIAYMGQDISKFLLLEKELQSLNPDENLSELTDKINEASSIAGKITGTLSALAEDPKFFTSYVFTQVNIPPL
ncbi:MAG: hypothetical protein OEX02_20880, partial [Cyclobacteriaceae bacterium]|nr:hypothetical protein [Cyclobacteriaceae bacterium]